ncbi:ATP-binding cassette domain-containing protein [uncultured Methanoregula sp.]|uniref:ABC transporter ATP-binding protein n=1 Tax=uncultured Methanoregula sp. TaxID=1005933 RepID=UPI002AAADFBB|nr:ATP-binding cassette domain-containing protein [uncultured Methanoregula sp.]
MNKYPGILMMKPNPELQAIPLIEFENITVFRNNTRALDRISVVIHEGENIAVLGPNGAGKSSFVRAVTRELYPVIPDEPMIFRIRGRDVWDVFELRSTIGIVSNDLQYTFHRGMSGREVILSGFFSSVGLFNHRITPAMETKADEICAFLEIGHLEHRLMNEMSSGEARRFLIGRALVHDPKTLILDEPTNSLDLHSLHAFRRILQKIARSGTGIVLITHNLHDIIPEISRVILMKEGRIVNDGNKTAMLTGTIIGDLFDVPLEVIESGGYYYAAGY